MHEPFCANLRYLCAEKGSVASVCREIGFNQQQFSKYLSGRACPSAHNLHRITAFFGVREEDLWRDHNIFVQVYHEQARSMRIGRQDPLAGVFPGDIRAIRPFVGAYQVFYLSPAATGRIVVAATFLNEAGGVVYSRSMEAPIIRENGPRQWMRGNGKAAYHSERLFIVDFERGNGGSLTSTVLAPPHRYRKGYLFGMMLFLASHPSRQPYASKTVWKKAPASWSAKDLLRNCGTTHQGAGALDSTVRNFLLDGTNGDANVHTHAGSAGAFSRSPEK